MLALVLDDGLHMRADWEAPRRTTGDALVAMRCAGVCDTDLQLVRGYMSFRGVLGHEFVGEVLEADDGHWVGKRVVADINASCGRCQECHEGNGHHCGERSVLGIAGRDGALAERLVIPESCLVAVPDSVSDEQAVFAEPLAAALHVLDVVEREERAIVLGDGKLGLLCAMALGQAGIRTTLIGRHREKLDLASDVETMLEDDAPTRLRAPVVVEATGTEAGIVRAMELCAPRGKLVMKSTIAGAHSIDMSPVVINELSIIGSRCGDIQAAIDTLACGRLDPRGLICARYELAEAQTALEHAGRRGALKVLVDGRK